MAVVEAVGPGPQRLAPGQLVVLLWRRNCGPGCAMCRRGRRDNCLTGEYVERGIFGTARLFVPICGGSRGRSGAGAGGVDRCGGAGGAGQRGGEGVGTGAAAAPGGTEAGTGARAGPIGILAAWCARSCGFDVTVLSREGADSARAQILIRNGVRYTRTLDGASADIVIEACGSATLAVESMRVLRRLEIRHCRGPAGRGAVAVPGYDYRQSHSGRQRERVVPPF